MVQTLVTLFARRREALTERSKLRSAIALRIFGVFTLLPESGPNLNRPRFPSRNHRRRVYRSPGSNSSAGSDSGEHSRSCAGLYGVRWPDTALDRLELTRASGPNPKRCRATALHSAAEPGNAPATAVGSLLRYPRKPSRARQWRLIGWLLLADCCRKPTAWPRAN